MEKSTMYIFKMRILRRSLNWTVYFLCLMAVPLILAGCSNSNNSGTVTFVQTIVKTSAYIESEMEKHKAVGLSIALVSNNQIVWSQGFGLADKENGIPATADTVYALGSGTKTISTTALLKLVEQGLVSLDSPAVEYLADFTMLPRFPNQMRNITVRRLLNHHSGIPGDIYTAGFVYGDPWNKWGYCDDYMSWLLNYLSTDYPSHPPGQMAVYCNTGFVLAGQICLEVGGQTGEIFPDYLDREVFSPLGMAHTSLFVIHENLAKGYLSGQPQEIHQTNCTFGATGGAFTTVNDMARFLIMVINGGVGPDGTRILAPETVAMLGEREKSSLDIDSYLQPGLGLDTMDDPVMQYAGRAWAKNGGTGDFHSLMEMLPDQKLSVVVLTNSDTASNMIYGVVQECLKNAVLEKAGISPSGPDLPTYASSDDPSEIAGIYVKKYGYDKLVDNGDGTMTWTANAQGPNPVPRLLTYSDNAWHPEGATESLIFKEMAWEQDTYFVIIQSGSSGSNRDRYMYGGYVRTLLGQKVSVPGLSEAWKARLGNYVLDNVPWNDSRFPEPFSILQESDGMLIHDFQSVAVPEDNATAFMVSLNNRSDSSIRVVQEDGKERVTCGGYRGYPIEQVPPVALGDVVKGTVSVFKSDWYRFDGGAAAQEVTVTVAPHGANYALTLFDSDLNFLAREMGALSFTAEEQSYFIAVSPTPDTDGEYTMTVDAAPETYFPVLEVSGSHYEIGHAIGTTFKERILKAFDLQARLMSTIEAFVETDRQRYYTRYLEAVQTRFPQFIEELQGMADGSGIPFEKFMLMSMFSELIYMMSNTVMIPSHGCSTVSYSHDGKIYLAHNEDLFYPLHDLMFIVKAHPTGKPSFISFCYPGMLMSIAPAMNDAGIFYSGNYITGTVLTEGGIPTSFIERSIMEAKTLDEAIQKATIDNRAYCYHVNLASRNDAKVVSLEVAPSTYYLQEVKGLFEHTNHFFQPGMETFSVQDANSISRLQVLNGLADAYTVRLDDVYGDLLTQFLSSHDNWPDSPCVHAQTEDGGQTLGSTLFDVNNGTWRIAYNNPCERKFQEIKF